MTPPPGYGEDLDKLVAEALASGTPDATVGGWYPSPLIVAVCIHGLFDLAEALFLAGATMTAEDFQHVLGWSADTTTARFLLERGVPYSPRCLRHAVAHDRWDTVFLFLEYGAHVQDPADYGKGYMSLLHKAAWRNNGTAVRELLERGAAVDARDFESMTPLMMYAC